MEARRWTLVVGGVLLAAVALAGAKVLTGGESPATEATKPDGFAARFAGYEAASEPNGDLAKVVWPEFVTRAGPEVQRLYEFQITNGDLMRYMPCFCGCGQSSGHESNRDCYVRRVNADGSVVLDPMAPT